MELFKIVAKVRMVSEDDMELEEMDLGMRLKSKEWVWREMGIMVYQIYKIISYSKGKSVVQMYDAEKILVQEDFDSLFTRWQEAVKDEVEPITEKEIAEQEDEEE